MCCSYRGEWMLRSWEFLRGWLKLVEGVLYFIFILLKIIIMSCSSIPCLSPFHIISEWKAIVLRRIPLDWDNFLSTGGANQSSKLYFYRESKDTKKMCKKLRVSQQPVVLKHYKWVQPPCCFITHPAACFALKLHLSFTSC